MHRFLVYTPEVVRAYDHLYGQVYAYAGVSRAALDVIGGFNPTLLPAATATNLGNNSLNQFGSHPATGNVEISGFTNANNVMAPGFAGGQISGTGPPAYVNGFSITIGPGSFQFSIGPGTVYVRGAATGLDSTGNLLGTPAATNYGDLLFNGAVEITQCTVYQQGTGSPFTVAAPGANSNFYLVYVTPQLTDTTASDDPNLSGGFALLPYYNSANPSAPLIGPPGSPGTSQPTMRKATGTVGITPLSNAASLAAGAAVLTVPVGAIPLYIVQVRSTDTTPLLVGNAPATNNFFLPGVGSTPVVGAGTITTAPFMHGLMQQHHLGITGTAPKLDPNAEMLPFFNPGTLNANFAYSTGWTNGSPGTGGTVPANWTVTTQTLAKYSSSVIPGIGNVQCFWFVVSYSGTPAASTVFSFTVNIPYTPVVTNPFVLAGLGGPFGGVAANILSCTSAFCPASSSTVTFYIETPSAVVANPGIGLSFMIIG